jgi:hypothetical protein
MELFRKGGVMKISALLRSATLLGLVALFAGCGGGGGGGGGLQEDRLYILYWDDIQEENVLAVIDPSQPGNVFPIGGFNFQQDIVYGLDRRPSNGSLYAYSQLTGSNTDTVVRINPNTGTPTSIGSNAVDADIPVGSDFNPVADVLRIVTANDINVRISPSNGSIVAVDTNLNPDLTISDIAYTNSFDGATDTTLYGIDIKNDNLVRVGGVAGIPSANGGVLTVVGPLGISLEDDVQDNIAHFDIDSNGNAYMLVTSWNGLFWDNDLYLVNLSTGAATFIGALNLDFEVAGMTAGG